MTTLTQVIARLETWTNAGIPFNYGDTRDHPPDSGMPCLISDVSTNYDFTESIGSVTIGNALEVTIMVRHLLLIASITAGTHEEQAVSLLKGFDDYVDLMDADPYLNGLLVKPLRVIRLRGGEVVNNDMINWGWDIILELAYRP